MNTLVKSFIVVNLVLSALFCAISMVHYATRLDYKQKYAHAQGELDKLKVARDEDNRRKDDAITQKENRIEALSIDTTKLGTERDKYVQDLKTAEATIAQQQEKMSEMDANIKTMTEDLQRRTDEARKFQEQQAKAQEEAQNARNLMIDLREQIVAFEKGRSDLAADLATAKAEREKVEERLKEKEWVLGQLQKHGVDIAQVVAREGEPDAPIHGKVLAVRPEVGMVLLSVGQQDKVKAGYNFTVYRGGNYVGKAQVENVYPKMSAAKILPDLQAKNQVIQEGDNASTRVY